jgi:hypothetical protein
MGQELRNPVSMRQGLAGSAVIGGVDPLGYFCFFFIGQGELRPALM